MRRYVIALLLLTATGAYADDDKWYEKEVVTPHANPASPNQPVPQPAAPIQPNQPAKYWFQKEVVTPHANPASPSQNFATPAQPAGISPTQLPGNTQSSVIIQNSGGGTSQSIIQTGNGTSIIQSSGGHTTQQYVRGPHVSYNHRRCNYITHNGALLYDEAHPSTANCPPVNRTFIPVYANMIVNPVTSEISDTIARDEFVIDSNRIIFTNLWRGTCHQSDCSLAAGYFASNPLQGMVMMTQPALSATPVILPAPTLSGPLTVSGADMPNGIITLQSLRGTFYFEDALGNSVYENGVAKAIQTPGQETYIFDLAKAKFVAQ